MNNPDLVDPAVTYQDVYFHMVRVDMAQIPRHVCPAGFRIRGYQPGDDLHWTALQYAAEPFVKITDELFEEQYGGNRAALPDRMWFVEADGASTPVASISAWWESDWKDPKDRGRIHWVVVHPDWQGCGLAKPMMTVALNRLAQDHAAAMLGTSSARPWALKVYLDCGFVPDPDEWRETECRAAWGDVHSVIGHPALEAMLATG